MLAAFHMDESEYPVRLRNIRVDLVGGAGHLEGALKSASACSGPLITVVRGVCLCEARIRTSKRGVELDRPAEHFAGGLVLRSLPGQQRRLSALEVFIGLQVARMALRD